MKELGYPLSGFDAYVTSTVLSGSGLSSSAAYETLVGNIFNHFCCAGRLDPVTIAKIGQYAENVYFGKPCGLMDQMGSSVGVRCLSTSTTKTGMETLFGSGKCHVLHIRPQGGCVVAE